MFIKIAAILYSMQMLTEECISLNLVDLSESYLKPTAKPKAQLQPRIAFEQYPLKQTKLKPKRRYWLVQDEPNADKDQIRPRVYEDEKDDNLKNKISILVQQTMHDSEKKMKTVEKMKADHREEAPYRAGFILSMVKKSKDVLDELFNVAIKHRNEWLALEQLKIFEIIVHTNVDTTNLLRQLVDIHVKHLNATMSDKKRVILI